jgi:hypothetical protein
VRGVTATEDVGDDQGHRGLAPLQFRDDVLERGQRQVGLPGFTHDVVLR